MDRDLYIKLYETMYRIRTVEEKVAELVKNGEIKQRFVHFHDGEEAVVAGVILALNDTDIVMSHHRAHAHYIAKGADLTMFFGELLGLRGCSRGYGGSMHLIDLKVNYYGSTSIVGGVVTVATGVAFALKKREEDRIVAAFFGDGATCEGVFYESLNVAALYGLPILYVVENNMYADHMPIHESRANPVIKDVAEAIGVEAYDVFGNDAVQVYRLVSKVIDKVRDGQPVLIEAITARYRGHIGTEPDYHVPWRKNMLRLWRNLDPLNIMKEKYLADIDLTEIERNIREEVEEACRKAYSLDTPEVMW